MNYTGWLPWIYLCVNGVVGVVVIVLGALVNSKLAIIHTTVNSNLAAKQQEVASEQAVNADLRVQLGHLNTVNAQLVAALQPKSEVVALVAKDTA